MIARSAGAPVGRLDLVPVGLLEASLCEALVEQLSRRTSGTWRLAPPWSEADLPLLPHRRQVDADALLARLEAALPAAAARAGDQPAESVSR